MGWFVAHLLLTMIVCIVMSSSGFGLATWQYWVVLIAMALTHIFGQERGEREVR